MESLNFTCKIVWIFIQKVAAIHEVKSCQNFISKLEMINNTTECL